MDIVDVFDSKDLDELLKGNDDEVEQELSIILTKNKNIYLVSPEVNKEGVIKTGKLLTYFLINWTQAISEKLELIKEDEREGLKIGMLK